ncbi:hypothetical protein [Isoptericola croceus]|uniref:hypothetical protein n=1 Tax=Isoptericola croceus TaxID=3031406 RepID=UPI0023F6B39F|nr:hypothetical protein [Isoptericola croceus]
MNRSFVMAIVLITLAALAVPPLYLDKADSFDIVGPTHWIEVSGTTEAAHSDDAAEIVRGVAAAHGSVARLVGDLHDPGGVRHVYVEPSSHPDLGNVWLNEGYARFSSTRETQVHRFDELTGRDPRGIYAVLSGQSATALQTGFDGMGLQTTLVAAPSALAATVQFVGSSPTGHASALAVLLVSLLSGIGVLAGSRRYAIQLLHGTSLAVIARRDLASHRPMILVSVSAVILAAIALVVTDLGVRRLMIVAPVAILTAAVFTACAITAYLTMLFAVASVDLVAGIKGRTPTPHVTPMLYLVRIPATLLAVIAVITAHGALSHVREYEASRAAWAAAEDVVSISFGGHMDMEEFESRVLDAGYWLNSLEEAGAAMLVLPERLHELADDVLIVNDLYLARHAIRSTDGTAVDPVGGDEVRILLPAGRSADEASVMAATQRWLREQLDFTASGENPRSPTSTVTVELVADGQQHFTYEAQSGTRQAPRFLDDSVVIVLNHDTGIVSPDTYLSWATQNRVLVTDHVAAAAGVEPTVQPMISAYRPVAQEAADWYADQVTNAWQSVIAAGVATLVTIVVAIGLGRTYVQRHAQLMLISYVHGWSFLRTHRRILFAEGSLVLLAGSIGLAQVNTYRTDLARSEMAGREIVDTAAPAFGAMQPFVFAAFVAVATLVFIAHLSARTASLSRTRNREAI